MNLTRRRFAREPNPLWRHRVTATRPSYIDGLVAWYDFSDPTTVYETAGTDLAENGDSIASVTDKSASGFTLTQSTAANQPTFLTDIRGDRSVGRFAVPSAGNCDFLRSNDLGALFAANDPITVLIALQANAFSPPIEPWTFTEASFGTYFALYTDSGQWVGDSSTAAVGITHNTNWSVIVFTHTISGVNGTVALYLNGSGPGTGTPTAVAETTAFDRFLLGTFDGGVGSTDYFFDGDIGEVLVYDSALSSANLNKAGRYLADRWGTTWSDVT